MGENSNYYRKSHRILETSESEQSGDSDSYSSSFSESTRLSGNRERNKCFSKLKKLKKRSRRERKANSRETTCIREAILGMDAELQKLSKSASKLEEEIKFHQASPYIAVRSIYSDSLPPPDHLITTSTKTFEGCGQFVSIPTKTVVEVLNLNEVLLDKQLFDEIVSCFFFKLITTRFDMNTETDCRFYSFRT